MKTTANFLAVDLGASSGRVLCGCWDGTKFSLSEVHRFPNGGVAAPGGVYWDLLRIWSEIKNGIAKHVAQEKSPLAGISVDAWGVDFGLLDAAGELLGNPHQYRDPRTDGTVEAVSEKISLTDLYRRIGVQTMQINTLFQLYSMVRAKSPQLEMARSLLMIPDLFHFFLSGVQRLEYTEASTTQMFSTRERAWETDTLNSLAIPSNIFPALVQPASVLDDLQSSIVKEFGLSSSFPVIAGASHDTASAVAAIPGLDEHSAFLSSGTWSLIGVEIAEPVTSQQAFEWDFTNEGGAGGSVLLMKNLPGLWLLQECQRQWAKLGQAYSWDQIVKLAEQSEPFTFFLNSEAKCFLNPADMPQAIRDYCRDTGQSLPAKDAVIARGCLENIVFKYRSALDRLEQLTGRKLTTLRVVGGGSQNRLLCQFTANATGRTVVAGPVEASALGNVMLQAIATGHLSDIQTGRASIAASIECSVFIPEEVDRWRDEYDRFQKFLMQEPKELAV